MSGLVRSFTQMLGLLSRKELAERLDQELGNVIDALENLPSESGKASITLTVEFKYELGRIDILPSFKTKLPDTAKFMRTPFWPVQGQLSVEHPNQADMFSGSARVIEGKTA